MSENKTPEGYVWVNKTVYNNIEKTVSMEESSNERILVPDFKGLPTGRVTVNGQVVKNLGNFESARVGVEISLPCLPTEEEVVRVYGSIQVLVGDILEEQLNAFDPVKVV